MEEIIIKNCSSLRSISGIDKCHQLKLFHIENTGLRDASVLDHMRVETVYLINNKLKIDCPNCGKHNTWYLENVFRPFCSDRCKLIDLGEWASESRKIPGDPINLNLLSDEDNDPNDLGDYSF